LLSLWKNRAMARRADIRSRRRIFVRLSAASIQASIHNHFNLERHLTPRETSKPNRASAMSEWRQLAA
jgi:putative transposase